jgi:hypothetical protein
MAEGNTMKEMEITVKDEISEEFGEFILASLRELPPRNIRWSTNGKLFFLFLPDDIDENPIKSRIIQSYGSKVKIRIIEKKP